jgi:hypothetical protein
MSKVQHKLALIILLVILLTGGWLIGRAASKNEAYSFLKEAVASQHLDSKLDNPVQGVHECYPPGKMKDYCPALRYKLDEETCQEIVAASVQTSGNCDESTGFEVEYRGKKISYLVEVTGDRRQLTVYASTP